MTRRLAFTMLIAVLVGACGSSGPTVTPTRPAFEPTITLPTEAPSPSAAPTAEPTVVPTPTAGPFDNANYSLTLPDGWVSFDMSDPAGQAALDAFVSANPEMAGSIAAFKAMKNVVMAVNQLLGNVIVTVSVPTGGLSLDVIEASFTSQFAAIPGVKEIPVADDVTLPAGAAKHWHLVIEANNPTGGTYTVGESIYLVANGTTAVLVEFVEVGGAAVPQEQQIIQTLAFK